MKRETMQALCDAAYDLGMGGDGEEAREGGDDEDLGVQPLPHYSGRGMMGRDTCAVVCDGPAQLLALAAHAGAALASEGVGEDCEAVRALVRDLARCRIDQLGLRWVVY